MMIDCMHHNHIIVLRWIYAAARCCKRLLSLALVALFHGSTVIMLLRVAYCVRRRSPYSLCKQILCVRSMSVLSAFAAAATAAIACSMPRALLFQSMLALSQHALMCGSLGCRLSLFDHFSLGVAADATTPLLTNQCNNKYMHVVYRLQVSV
jgi:hypothetical protein